VRGVQAALTWGVYKAQAVLMITKCLPPPGFIQNGVVKRTCMENSEESSSHHPITSGRDAIVQRQ